MPISRRDLGGRVWDSGECDQLTSLKQKSEELKLVKTTTGEGASCLFPPSR